MRKKYIDNLVQNFESRFPNGELQTIECMDILLNPRRYPDKSTDIGTYGVHKLHKLLSLCESMVYKDRAKAHFWMFKHLVMSQKALTFDRFIKVLISEYTDEYPDFVVLAKIALLFHVRGDFQFKMHSRTRSETD